MMGLTDLAMGGDVSRGKALEVGNVGGRGIGRRSIGTDGRGNGKRNGNVRIRLGVV